MATVFLSYRHESDEHRTAVRALAERLETAGQVVVLDQLAQERDFRGGGPNEGWPRWSKSQAANKDHVALIVASPGWFRCYEGKEVPGLGLGAGAEAGVIEQRLYNYGGTNPDIRIVTFESRDVKDLPLDLQRYHMFNIADGEADLLRWLNGGEQGRVTLSAPLSWARTTPMLHWPLCDHDNVREAFAHLLTEGFGHKALLLRGPSGCGKTAVTEQLLGNAMRMPGLACGRFDFKGTTRLREELDRFASHLGVALPRADRINDGLSEILRAILARSHHTLLIFDTFEAAGEAEDWMKKTLLTALIPPNVGHVRVVVAGQAVPQRRNAPWASEAIGPIEIGEATVDDWYCFGQLHRPGLTRDFVAQAYAFCGGRAPVLSQLLGPSQ